MLQKIGLLRYKDENVATKEAAGVEIGRLTASLLAESQEKYPLNEELKDLTCKYEGIVEEKKQMVAMTESSPIDNEVLEKIQSLLYLDSKLYKQILELELDNRSNETVKVSEELRVIKDEKDSLQTNLQRSEEKASLLREKLSMPVKKGKGLIQERENLKQQITEKNAQIETNTILQEIIETIDGTNINLPIDVNEPVEKVKWFATYLIERQIGKAQVGQELGMSPTVPPASFDNDWNTGMTDDDFNAEDAASIGSYVGNTQELEAKHDKWGPELSGFFGNLKVMLKDESLLTLLKQSFEKKVESLKEIERLVKDVNDSFDTELLQDYPAIDVT
ncbi:hypothetical protein Tco_0804386 [Tanacetum coccineum]|uniref:Uncharacterized protein n=1 Tax=Tanacetum coccineum TaxID=301880 RepID=A0ABQ5A8I2_9ASTR